ncbi:hypothetical protein J42TS3_21830 [Paenibacillus vini]|uniref:Uncharacterized protein n=1 Tax=Paenibacillus vini TaxID=1476024 RepID=A0ABQ4MAY0_9BACL|nr:hypothetical protein J42TS3_21830 [Paenibacillus vini]
MTSTMTENLVDTDNTALMMICPISKMSMIFLIVLYLSLATLHSKFATRDIMGPSAYKSPIWLLEKPNWE